MIVYRSNALVCIWGPHVWTLIHRPMNFYTFWVRFSLILSIHSSCFGPFGGTGRYSQHTELSLISMHQRKFRLCWRTSLHIRLWRDKCHPNEKLPPRQFLFRHSISRTNSSFVILSVFSSGTLKTFLFLLLASLFSRKKNLLVGQCQNWGKWPDRDWCFWIVSISHGIYHGI